MECELARKLLVFARPGVSELDPADVAALESHLADCADCSEYNRKENCWDERLARAMQAVPLPVQGRARVEERLIAARSAWRCRAGLRLAGAVLVASLVYWVIPSPRLDSDAIIADAYDQVGNRDGVAEWLTHYDKRFGFPPQMNAKYLISCERRDFHGVKAPVLTFVRQSAQARVAVLSSRQFRNLPTLPAGRAAENSVCTLFIIRDPDSADVVFVVEVINGPIELFYNEPGESVT